MSCGQPLGLACTRCGAGLQPDARFCPACGARAANLVETALEDETLKIITVLFADVVGSTAQAEGMHPEEIRELMTDFFEVMSKEIRAHGGIVERIIGDAVMADFGVPVVHEDDPVRAISAGMKMLERLEDWNADKDPSRRIQIRIGVNTGEVSAAGSPGQDLLVTGDAVNVAARLQEAASAGAIVIGERTAAAARDHFLLRSLDPLTVKGKAEPIRAFVVEGPSEVIDFVRPGLQAPMVGRDEQLRLLGDIFDHVKRDGAPHLVTLIGDAGVGKSRLAREFITAVEGKVAVGRCLPEGSGTTYWPLAEVLKGEAGVFDTDAPDAALEKIAELVRSVVPGELVSQPARMVAALASTIGLEADEGPLSETDPREVKRDLVAAWRTLLTGMSSRSPLVIGIDDIYWADQTLLEVVEDLAGHVRGPVLFLCLARPDLLRSRPDWGGGLRNYSAISLDSLSPEQSAELMSLLVGRLPESLSNKVLERSEGNPFFLEEVIRKLIDEGTLVRDDGTWRTQPAAHDIEIPDTVQAVIASRLDLLSSDERHVVRLAAVIGRTFWPGAIRHLTKSNHLPDTLHTLERRDLIYERLASSMPGEPEYSFKHILIRDVAYESLPRKRRGDAHAATAQWIETKSGQRREAVAEILAYHYDNAFQLLGDEALRAHARAHCLAAARSALRRFAIQQAEGLGRRAVELSSEGSERIEALEALGDLYALTFKSDGAWRAYTDALAELQKTNSSDNSGVAHLAAKAAIVPSRWRGTMLAPPAPDEIARVLEVGLRAAGDEDIRDRSLLLSGKAFLLSDSREETAGKESGEELAREAVEIAERVEAPDLVSVAMDAASGWLWDEGRYGESHELARKRIELTPSLTDVREMSDAYANAALSAYEIGFYREAIEHATKCVQAASGVDAGSYLNGLVWRVCARFMAGEWDGALVDQAEIERLHEEDAPGLPGGLAMYAYGIAMLCHELRGEEAAFDAYVTLARAFNEHREGTGQPFHSYLGPPARALVHRGEFEEARAWLRMERSHYSGSHLTGMCEVLIAQQDWTGAAVILPVVREEVAVGQLQALDHFADRLEGRMAAAFDDHSRSEELLRRSAEGLAALGAPWEEAWSRLLLGERLLSSDRKQEADREISFARTVFERLKSRAEVERSGKLLAELGA
jgi:class 3 adenylate cyclase/tetratricopeptide (TPR) repeat protein